MGQNNKRLTAVFFVSILSMAVVALPVSAEPVFDERTSDHVDLTGASVSDNSVKKLTLGDFDKDGAEDILVLRRSGDPKLFMNVAGVLTRQNDQFADISLATQAYDAATFDANGDTWPDLVIGRVSAKPSLYLNLGENGGGVWQGFDTGTTLNVGVAAATMVEAGDIDGDNDIDVLTLIAGGSRQLLINNGSGVFTNETGSRIGSNVLQGVGKIQLGDVDNDSDIDVIAVFGSENQQTIYYNDGNGNYPNSSAQNLDLANLTYIPVGADFNGDDIFDYRVYADNFNPTAFMSEGTFTGGFPDYERRFDGDMIGDNGKHGFAHIRDVDGDGDPDFIISSIEMLGTSLSPDPRNELNEMVINDGVFDGTFSVYADPEWRTEESFDVLFTDVTMDGNIDLFIAHQGRYAVYVNDAPPQTVELTGFNPVVTQAGSAATLSVIVTGGVNPSFSWTMGDGTVIDSGTSNSVQHTYALPGRYQVTVNLTDSAGTDQISFWQIVHDTLVAGKSATSSTIVLETRAGQNDRIWVVNTDNNSVTAIDAVTQAFFQEIAVGATPSSLTLLSATEMWVVNKDSGDITIINPATRQVTGTLDILPYGSSPHGIVAAPDNAHVYVALEARGEVVKINVATQSIVATTAVEATPRHLAINAAGSILFVSRFITPPVPGESTRTLSTGGSGEVRRVETISMSVLDTLPLVYNDVLDTSDSARGIPNYVMGVTISPDGLNAVVPSNSSNIYRGLFRDGNGREHDQLVRSMLARLDLNLNTEQMPLRFDFDDNSQPTASIFGPTGNHLFVIHEGSRSVHILDVYANQIIVTRIAGITPRGLVLSDNGETLFVHNYLDRSVTVFDIKDLMNGVENAITEVAVVSTVVIEGLAPNILQGKKFFFDAADSRLSSQAYLSCASCHADAGHDGRTWDFSDGGEGLRNTIDLRGRAGVGHGNVHWTANFDEIHDFENDIRGVFDGTGLMSDPDFLASSFTLGVPKAGLSADLDALAAFTATLTDLGQSPYRDANGNLTADAAAGEVVFSTSNCQSCHTRKEFTDSPQSFFHNVGTVDLDTGQRLGQPLVNGGLDTPTLRGLWHGAPYLHDGSAATVGEAILAHTDIAVVGFDVSTLNAQELLELEAYALSIDDSVLWAPHPDGNYPPDVNSPGNQETPLSASVNLSILASDLEGTSLSYVASGLPDGLTLGVTSGVVSGSPTLAGNFPVTLTVTDGDNENTVINFDWLITTDTDSDGVLDHLDNCSAVSNASQLDSNGDGFGNLCDPDTNNDCLINFLDVGGFSDNFMGSNPDYDFNGDGNVNFLDYPVLTLSIFGQPGPSGLANCGN